MKKISTVLAINISKEAKDQRPVEVIAYGLEIILNLGTQLAVLSILSYLLGIFPTVMISVIVAVIFRTFSGGTHLSSFSSCTMVSLISFISIGYMAAKIAINTEVLMALYLINFLLLAKWAPYSPKRKYSKNKRRAIKQICIALLLVAFCTSFYLPIQEPYIIALALGLTWQTISITPWGVNLIAKADNLLKERGEKNV
ncbi:accessory gene regulator ArgB-like protein [Desulfotomaculum sp. 1211_IL3151]|uniref:accessory gene regulator ArgB-like protein n=1 Tax=Desulfotomaculum sp. 1211_IL3151 TaxID=3084055 RepID=UPI002FD98201